jgi:hypothetical protein
VKFSDNTIDYEEFKDDILKFEDGERVKEGQNELIPFVKKHLFEDTHDNPVWYNLDTIYREFKAQNTEYFRQNFFRYFVVRLDGKNRFRLAHGGQYHIWRTSSTPFNYLSTLYMNADEQKNLAEIVNEEFGWYTYFKKDEKNVINIFLNKNLKIEISSLGDKHNLGPSEQIQLAEFGDGVQCFVGICLSVLSCPLYIYAAYPSNDANVLLFSTDIIHAI